MVKLNQLMDYYRYEKQQKTWKKKTAAIETKQRTTNDHDD